MKLSDVRKKIDNIDDSILKNLNQRAEYAKLIGELKHENNFSIHDAKREQEILDRLMKINKGPLSKENIKAIFTEVFSACISIQKNLKVVYLGPEATYCNIAAVKYFGKSYTYIPCRTINDIFAEVEKSNADFGVVPIENSTEGIVTYTLDLFTDSDLKIYGEIFLDINHNLISKCKNFSEVKKVYTHVQVLGQCRNWLEKNLPNALLIETDSTTLAAQKAAKEANTAAISSDLAAQKYKLNILASNIQDLSNNKTRFFVISKKMCSKVENSKTSVLFSVKDRPGALYDMLTPFKDSGINLTKIESRPTKKRAWEYIFYIDFLGHIDDKNIENALTKLEKQSLFLKVLGSYPIGEEEILSTKS
jgi:chorismate mutase / prephenate dehydratase